MNWNQWKVFLLELVFGYGAVTFAVWYVFTVIAEPGV